MSGPGDIMDRMSGVDTVRGISFQHAQAILAVLDGLDSSEFDAIRVEGVDDVVDIEVFRRDGTVKLAMQAKTRSERTWGEAEILRVLRRWAQLPAATGAEFEFVTDGRLGPTGEKLALALEAAHAGSIGDIATLLGEDPSSPLCVALSRVRVRQDPSGTEALLGRAERQLLSMLPAGRSRLDLPQLAEQGVDRLFRTLSERAGSSDPAARRLTREELAGIVGVPADQSAATRWPGVLRTRYLQAAGTLDTGGIVPALLTGGETAPPVLVRRDIATSEPLVAVSQLLDGARAAVVGGKSGTGKTTAAASLRREAALADRVVLVAHAEAYLPGRLAALAADALAEVLQEDVATSTGRQALADGEVVMVIDGVSEVPQDFRQALGDDLRPVLTLGQGAHVVLLGRDIPALNSVVPTSRPPSVYLVANFGQDRRRDLAARIAGEHGLQDPAQNPVTAVEVLLAKAYDVLGEAVDNPMLLSMALNTLCAGLEVHGRAGVFQAAVEYMARRGGVAEADTLSAVLGVVYCELLDAERRYADGIEWSMLLRKAAAAVEQFGVACAVDRLDQDARKCGLVSALGWTRMIVPVHDAFADYLAGYAHGRGLVPLPRSVRRSDEARILFAAEVGGVDQQLALTVARDAPFLTVELAQYDNCRPGQDTPEAVERLMALLIGPGKGRVGLSDCGGGAVVALYGQVAPGWIDRDVAREAMVHTPAAVVEDASPLRIAVRLWRLALVQRLAPRYRREGQGPRDIDQVRAALADHVERVGREVRALVSEIAPPGHAVALLAGMAPLGIRAIVQPVQQQPFGGPTWPVVYEPSDKVNTALLGEPSMHTGAWMSTTFEHLTRSDPQTEAVDRVRNALERQTAQNWLAPPGAEATDRVRNIFEQQSTQNWLTP